MSASIVAYYRVSTQRQGKSGLGLEAQRKAVAAYAASQGLTIADQFTEVETGKGADALERRPMFATALQRAKKLKAPIVVAKLDRLSRDVAFIATLMAKRVEFVAQADANKAAAAARDADLRPIFGRDARRAISRHRAEPDRSRHQDAAWW
jgi:DNA invertase Pin-like site-specific DNA recombinase